MTQRFAPLTGFFVALSVYYVPASLGFQIQPQPPASGRRPDVAHLPSPVASVGPEGGEDVVHLDTQARRSLPSHLRLVPIHGKGLGVITTQSISAQTVVGDYAGELLWAEEKDRRYLETKSHLRTQVDLAWIRSREERGQTVTGSYLYGVVLPSSHGPGAGLGIGMGGTHQPDRIYVDAEDEHCSLWTRFINHAPGRGANLTPKSIHESWDGKPRVWFVANRDIEEGEELCFDYGEDYWLEGDDVVL